MAARDDSWKVTAARELQPKSRAATLHVRGASDTFTDVAYAYSYTHPIEAISGVEKEGAPYAETTLVLYQEGETSAPHIDDKVTDSDSHEWVIMKVLTRLNYKANWGVHRCTVRRTL